MVAQEMFLGGRDRDYAGLSSTAPDKYLRTIRFLNASDPPNIQAMLASFRNCGWDRYIGCSGTET